jgi:hypothetical protein
MELERHVCSLSRGAVENGEALELSNRNMTWRLWSFKMVRNANQAAVRFVQHC